MSDQIEAAGALVTAGLAAHSLDHGAAGDGTHGGACANCAAPLSGPFCAQCGQHAHLHRTLGAVFHEFLHGITHFDGKAWHTLPMLLFRPGRLTRSYIEGHRARYIAPVPLFLMVIFLMFFVLSFVHLPDDAIDVGGNATPAQRTAEVNKALASIDKDIAAAEAAGNTAEAERLRVLRAGVGSLGKRATQAHAGPNAVVQDVGRELAAANARGDLNLETGLPWLDAKAKEALKNPALVLYKLQSKAYKLSFLLVPLSLPWLWLAFFWRPRVNGVRVGMYDHAIFALYSISFMSLLFIAGSLAVTAGITTGLFWQILLLLPAVHMFAQLRGTYALGWWGAGWRTLYLSLAAVLTLSAYLVILVVLGVLD